MSTMILDVNNEQEQILDGLLKYMDVSFQKINNRADFWLKLSEETKSRIQKGLLNTDKGEYSSAKCFLENLLEK
jgi:trehalose-6-phosphate synthase